MYTQSGKKGSGGTTAWQRLNGVDFSTHTPGVGLTLAMPCCPAWIHLTALGTGPTRSWALWDLDGEGGPDMTASTGS